MNQIETHPYFQRDSLVKFCQKYGICVTAHTPLGGAAANTEWFGTVSCLDDTILQVIVYDRSTVLVGEVDLLRKHASEPIQIATKNCLDLITIFFFSFLSGFRIEVNMS